MRRPRRQFAEAVRREISGVDGAEATSLGIDQCESPTRLDDLVTTILASAEVTVGSSTYDDSSNVPPPILHSEGVGLT